MFSLRQCLKDILQRFKNEKDYVVEQGESGIWTYRKWNSGYCELVGRRDATVVSGHWVAFGNQYYAGIDGRDFPFTLVELYDSDMNAWSESGYIAVKGSVHLSSSDIHPSNSRTGSFCIVRPVKVTSSIVYHLTYRVIGKWK